MAGGAVSPRGRRWANWLTDRLRTLVTSVKTHTDNERFAKFLEQHLDEAFTFHRNPDVVSATNNESESGRRFMLPAAWLGEFDHRIIPARAISSF